MEEYKIEEYENEFYILINGWLYHVELNENSNWGKVWDATCYDTRGKAGWFARFQDRDQAKDYIIKGAKYRADGNITQKDLDELYD